MDVKGIQQTVGHLRQGAFAAAVGQWGRDRWWGGQWGHDRWWGGQWGRDRWRGGQ